ncbi:MAG TPA: hypothetical protein VIL37_19080 [Natronosporangium sp.]
MFVTCFVFAGRFHRLGEPGWRWYSVAAAVAYLILGFASFPAGDFRLMLAGGIVVWSWASVVALRLLLTNCEPVRQPADQLAG